MKRCLFAVTLGIGFSLFVPGAKANVLFDAVGPNSGGDACSSCISLNWTHITSGANRLLTVGVAVSAADVSGMSLAVTYNSISMISAGKVNTNNGSAGFIQLFYLIAPTTGSNTVSVTLSGGSADMEGGSVSFVGVDQLTPVRHINTAFGSSASPSVSVSSTPGNVVVDAVAAGDQISSSGQTNRWLRNQNSAHGAGNAAQSTAAGASAVTMSYATFSDIWGIIAMDVVAKVGVQVSSRSDTLSDSRPSATSNHTVAFTINNSLDTTGWGQGSGSDATDTMSITFDAGFNVNNIGCKDVDISFGGTATSIAGYNVNRSTSTNCKGSATSWGLFIDTSANTLTFYTPTAVRTYVATGTQVQILIGTNASFQDSATNWITNPSTAGIYTISVGGTFGGSGNMLVSINLGVTVQATVAESLALTVSSVAAVNCTADDGASVTAIGTTSTTIPFGNVSLNTFYIGCQDLVVSTNAGGGYSITTQESSVMKTSDGRFTIPDTTCDGGTCTESAAAAWTTPTKNGLGHTCFNQDGNHDCDSSYTNGTKFRQFANIAGGETPQAIMSSSTPASVTARIKHRLSAGTAQAAGAYTTLITYTIYATY